MSSDSDSENYVGKGRGKKHGGVYRGKKMYKDVDSARNHFLKMMDNRGYTPTEALDMWNDEEENPVNLSSPSQYWSKAKAIAFYEKEAEKDKKTALKAKRKTNRKKNTWIEFLQSPEIHEYLQRKYKAYKKNL